MNRLKEREDCHLRINFKEVEGRTKRQIEEERKKDMLEYNMATFGRVSVGVHGKELPKFSEEPGASKYWWTLKGNYQ